jgi:hypothetical protein
MPTLHFSTTQAGQTWRRINGTARSKRRREVRVDGRLRQWLQVKAKVAEYSKALGKRARDAVVKARIQELAELEVLASELRGAGLRGELRDSFWMYQVGRFTNSADKLRQNLGLHAKPTEPEIPEILELQKLIEAD